MTRQGAERAAAVVMLAPLPNPGWGEFQGGGSTGLGPRCSSAGPLLAPETFKLKSSRSAAHKVTTPRRRGRTDTGTAQRGGHAHSATSYGYLQGRRPMYREEDSGGGWGGGRKLASVYTNGQEVGSSQPAGEGAPGSEKTPGGLFGQALPPLRGRGCRVPAPLPIAPQAKRQKKNLFF